MINSGPRMHHGTSLPNALNQLIMRLCSVADKKFVRYCYFLSAFSDNLSAVQPAKREFGPALAGAGRLFRPLIDTLNQGWVGIIRVTSTSVINVLKNENVS
jgi:hypothetical protein